MKIEYEVVEHLEKVSKDLITVIKALKANDFDNKGWAMLCANGEYIEGLGKELSKMADGMLTDEERDAMIIKNEIIRSMEE